MLQRYLKVCCWYTCTRTASKQGYLLIGQDDFSLIQPWYQYDPKSGIFGYIKEQYTKRKEYGSVSREDEPPVMRAPQFIRFSEESDILTTVLSGQATGTTCLKD
ncbi:Uncharacterised protein at_DN0602 [Pycnogonum litorale]